MARALRFALLLVVAAAFAGCKMSTTNTPPLSGPSELGLSLTLQARPDILTQDGSSQATLTIVARDASGLPTRRDLRVDVLVDGKTADFGTLSQHNVTTGSDGQATVVYTAPPATIASTEQTISLAVTPVGTNYANSLARTVDIHLVPSSVITPPDVLTPVISITPTSPKALQDAIVDGSASTAPTGRTIVRYVWDFGDGTIKEGMRSYHDWGVARNYLLKLTVTDDLGNTATATMVVTVTP
jgi:hypothetical protein